MLQKLIDLDQQLFLWLNSQHHPYLDGVMLWATGDTAWLPLYVLIIGFFIYHFRWQTWKILLQIALLITLADQFASAFMKPFVQRLRPCYEPLVAPKVHLVTVGCGGQYGFISSHAANTFALAFFLYLLAAPYPRYQRWVGITFFAWAFWVTYTRIYVGVHYPADVWVGAFSGIFWAWLVYKLGKTIKWNSFS